MQAIYHLIKQVADISDKTSTGSDPVASLGVSWLIKRVAGIGTAGIVGFGLQLTRYFGKKNKEYYSFYAKRISDELALRGIAPSTL